MPYSMVVLYWSTDTVNNVFILCEEIVLVYEKKTGKPYNFC